MPSLRHLAAGTLVAGIAVVVLLTWQAGVGDITALLMGASVAFVLFWLLSSLLIALVHAWKWQLILHSQGRHVPYHRLFAYRLVGYSVNYLTPTMHAGSEPIRALLLKREGIPTSTAFGNVIIDKSVEIICNVVFFFIGALLIVNSVAVSGGAKVVVLCFSLILMLLMGMFVAGILNERSMFIGVFRFLRLHKMKRLQHVERNLADIEKEIELFYRTKRQYFLALIGIIVILWILMYLEYKFAFLILGIDATPVQIFLILTGVGLAYSIPVPAAMGTLEIGQFSAAKVLALSGATGIALAFIIRTRDLIWTVLGLAYTAFYQFSFERLAKKTHEFDERFEEGSIYES